MWAVPAGGGAPVHVTGADTSQLRFGRRWPLVLPGGKAIAYVNGNSPTGAQQLSVVRIGSGESTEIGPAMLVPLGVFDDQLVYVSAAGNLMSIRFDRSRYTTKGDAIQLDDGIVVDPTAGAKASLSASGTLAYLRGRAQFQPVVITGSAAPAPLIREAGSYATPRFSP